MISYDHQFRQRWTAEDLSVVCRQLGFTGGQYYEWQDKPNNDTKSLLLETPACSGSENSIEECGAWGSKALGGGVCDLHPDLGVACGEYHADWRGSHYWKGIDFLDAQFDRRLQEENTQYIKVSKSRLSYVDIQHAGSGPLREVTAAVHAFSTPPLLDHFSISGSVYTAINFTMPATYVSLYAANITGNRGYGVYVNSSTGGVKLEGSSVVSDNQADGVKYNFHQREPIKSADRSFMDFCQGSYSSDQTYPLVMVAEQQRNWHQPQDCHKLFTTYKENYVFTLHFNYMLSDDETSAFLEVRDRDQFGELLTRFTIRNGTFPPSVVSRTNQLYVKYTAASRKQAIIYMEIIAGRSKIPDLSVNDTLVSNNLGHGVSVENLRSAVYVHKSNLTGNQFGSGLNVRRGSGDVNVTYSTIMENIGDGVNVTYEGGLQNVTWSTVARNKLRGIALWFNESGQNTTVRQETAIAYSNIESNLEIGVLVGNFCRHAFINITSNKFYDGYEAAVQIESCWNHTDQERNVLITNNIFEKNNKLAVKVNPAINMNLSIEWNQFRTNKLGTILIRNEDVPELDLLPMVGRISNNIFQKNTGRYVMLLSLTTPGIFQSLHVTYNRLQDNVVSEPYLTLSSRSRAAGVVCLGSNNIKVYRNLLENPESSYELSSHSFDQSTAINATYNWLGKKTETQIFERILDTEDRYNLARISFHPFLLSDSNMDTLVVSTQQMAEPSFYDPFDNTIIGGVVNGHTVLTEKKYTVKRDIYIDTSGELSIPFDTVLEFEDSIGVMVAGLIRAEGSGQKKVRFTLAGTTAAEEQKRILDNIRINEENEIDDSTDDELHAGDMTERTFNISNEMPGDHVKLIGGRDALEGRLMIYSGGRWGTVCSHGWTEDAAAVACQQLGYVLNPEDWLQLPGDLPEDGQDAPIVRGNIVCDEFDTDVSLCRSDNESELENSCRHADDVGLRCYPRSWAGVRLGITAKESYLKGVIIEKAGLLDYSSRAFKPALQVDFHQHVLQDLDIRDNLQDGVGVIYCDQYSISNPNSRVFRNSAFYRNKRHGISFRQLGANITGSEMTYNGGSGLHFNPFLRRSDQREMTGWLKLLSCSVSLPSDSTQVVLEKDQPYRVCTTTLKNQPSKEQTLVFTTDQRNVIGIQVLSPVSSESSEKITLYDYKEITSLKDVNRWDLKEDQVVFPTTTSSYVLTLHYVSGSLALGDVFILLTAVDRRHMAMAGDLKNYRSKWPMVFLSNSRLTFNDIGISTLHYNSHNSVTVEILYCSTSTPRYLTEQNDHLLRSSNETIQVYNCSIEKNINQAVYVLSPYRVRHDNHHMAEFTFMINKTSISNNGLGVVQNSWDIRESNNLFHWVFESVAMKENTGGVSLSLPYVWKFNENFTHSVYVNSSSFSSNTGFGFVVDGHFAKVNITSSRFEDNTCKRGAFSMRGMEKQMFIHDNKFSRNIGKFMIEFNMDSQSDILGDVLAYFEYNIVQNNKHYPVSMLRTRTFQAASTAVTIKGLQKVNITHNLFGSNEMDYELLAGLYTARIKNYVNVEANWWGSANGSYIRERIFDFNDWNNYAIADYLPYLTANSLNAPVKSEGGHPSDHIDFNALGGQLFNDLVLQYRPEPYVVKSDLTVMPGVTLTVKPGVIIEFYPGIGILVLGRLLAVGMRGNHIKFQPVDLSKTVDYRYAYSTAHPRLRRSLGPYEDETFDAIVNSKDRETRSVQSSRQSRLPIDVRLCIEGECGNRRDGFLELYNVTTRQWVPVCDDRFTERNAQVVCHQLGYNKLHYFLGRNIRTEMYPNALVRVRTWPEPIQCQGTEMNMAECPIRMNGQIFDHRYECSWNDDFVYISCGERHLPNPDLEYWGGVRFSIPSFEHSRVYSRIHDPYTHHHGPYNSSAWPSVMEYVDVMGAGVLHNEFSPAIMSFHDAPRLRGVAVTYSASDGVTLISAVDPFDMLYNRFEHNLGYGISVMGLTGETRESDESSFMPLTHVRLPYHVFGMVDICDSAKEMIIEERVLLYYKYDNKPVDCVKIFSSVYDVKNFGIRFLQFNLFNSTWDSIAVLDQLLLYDGELYNETSSLLATLHANTTNHMKLFKTTSTRLSVQLHATGASGAFGFVAEVLTLPISNIGIDRDVLQNFTFNEYYNNEEGAMYCATAGEVNPWLTVSWSRIEHNGVKLYGNFTTTRAALYFDLQNVQDVFIKNNLIRNNTGGLYILTGSMGAATKLQANITNNLFVETQHLPSLYIETRALSAYQNAYIRYNDFSFSYSPYHDVITLAQVISDFSYNYAHANLGRHILDIYGFEKVRLPVYQTTSHNHFARNQAVDPTYQGTVIVGSAGQQFVDNVFYNWDNAYEMVAVNESVRCNVSTECTDNWMYQPDVTLKSDVWKTPINARNNWWGFNKTAAVSGRIHDRLDDDTLLRVDFTEFKLNNFSLLRGCEPGYSLVGKSCYHYVGAPMTYDEAKDYCRRDNASLPFLQTYYGDVQLWLKEAQLEYLWETDAIWVQHYDVVNGCPAFVNRQVRATDCFLNLPFICESDPDNTVDPYAWASDTLVIGAVAATIGCLILVFACVTCWACKSSDRRKQRLSRRSSIRASIRSNRSVISNTSTSGFSDLVTSRAIHQNPNARSYPTTAASSTTNGTLGAEGGRQPLNMGTLNSGMNGSMDSMNKNFEKFMDDEADLVSFDSRSRDRPFNGDLNNRCRNDPALQNANSDMMVGPNLNNTYQNAYFLDNSNMGSANLPTPTYINDGRLPPQQPGASHDQTSEKFSSFSGSRNGLPGTGRSHAPPLGQVHNSPQKSWSKSQGNIYNTLSLSSSYRYGSEGGESTQNFPDFAVPPATSYGTPAGGSVASGQSSRHVNDVTPPDEMYNMATLPREHPPPPRYPSEDNLRMMQYDSNMPPEVGSSYLPDPSQPLNTQSEAQLINSRSLSSSQPLETSM
ncbi:SRCR domain [Trinorchestia longiramus]|nr:SRCR domain [Trinorchestia longiramus]